jgi:hypothetical protein
MHFSGKNLFFFLFRCTKSLHWGFIQAYYDQQKAL